MLRDLYIDAARRSPDALAIRAPDGEWTYGALDALANRMSRALVELGVTGCDRLRRPYASRYC